MKKVFAVALMLFASSLYAADLPLSWDAAQGATSYRVQMSTDNGLTWEVERPVPTGTVFTWVGAPDSGLVLFRVVSVNSAGSAIRSDVGAWYNGAWKIPGPAKALGIE